MQIMMRAALAVALMTGTVAGAAPSQQQPAQQPAATARPLFAIVYRAGPAWKPGVPMKDQGLRDHFYYVKALHERGGIVYAGTPDELAASTDPLVRQFLDAKADGPIAFDNAALDPRARTEAA